MTSKASGMTVSRTLNRSVLNRNSCDNFTEENMKENNIELLFWSALVGFFGWMTWELNIEKSKAEQQIEEATKRKKVQSKYRQ
jgi:hypothetical protein